MAWRYEKDSGDVIIDGWQNGIASSPHKGIANLQAVNISTETDEVMVSYARIQQMGTFSATYSVAPSDSTHLTLDGAVPAGIWITVSGSTITGLSNGNYYILSNVNGNTSAQLSSTYNGSAITGLGATGTANFIFIRNISTQLASATEHYGTSSYRYYILDDQGLVWVYDTATADTSNALTWFLPDTTLLTNATGIAVLNGWLMVFANNNSPATNQLIWCKPTVLLASSSPGWAAFAAGILNSLAASNHPHFALVGHQGTLTYTDGNFLGTIFPTTSYAANVPNVFSYFSYTTSTDTGTIATLVNGALPYATDSSGSVVRIPVAPFSSGSVASALSAGTVVYLEYSKSAGTFKVYAAASGGSALDITSGASGTQYFNTFYPTSSSGKSTYVWSPFALTLPYEEEAQCLVEIQNLIVVGTKGNTLYQWGQVNAQADTFIPLPENNVAWMVTVNNMAYIGAGNKGNVYVTNGSTASLVISVPDYCAGIPGTQSSYIEPYFTWGGAMYLRGRVYFSILDQTSTKAGNCGGIWSFVPTQNFFIGQDTGLALRIENQNSYATYSGVATVLLPSQNQAAKSPQYWSGWYSSVSNASYGIDGTATMVSTAGIIETDLIPTGTFLQKKTFKQIEYKLAAPLQDGESVGISYRLNATDSYTSCGTADVESTTGLSGYFKTPFEKTQLLQLKINLVTATTSSPDGVRLLQVRVR